MMLEKKERITFQQKKDKLRCNVAESKNKSNVIGIKRESEMGR